MIIGITGGIGSGKSTIAKGLAKCGYTVYDCDKEAKRIVEENEKVQKAIIHLLGSEAFIGKQYNTSYVAKRVFAEPELLAQLNAIIHPAVKADILSTFTFHLSPFTFLESAILYESGFDILCDKIIVVDAPEEIRIARTIKRDYHGQASIENINKVRARMKAQQTHQGDLLIINDGNTPISELVEKITHWM